LTEQSLSLQSPPFKLNNLNNYDDFLNYSKSLFNLEPDEHRGLYSVLLKLQSIDMDPFQIMDIWKNHSDEDEEDCHELIRLLIKIDNMDFEAGS
jgi:hypothetical protein